jgi:Bacterial Ig domain
MMLWILLCLLLAPPAWAAHYHVRLDGDNTHCAGTAPLSRRAGGGCAWRTIAHALSQARAGDVLQLGPGRFTERLRLSARGTPLKPVTLRGTRGAQGEYETILDGSTAVPGDAWTARGDGSFTAQLPQTPYAMTSKGLAIWRVGQHAWEEGPRAPDVFGIPADADITTNIGTVKFWDGISALFGYHNGTTYLRFRNNEHPRDMDVRWAQGGAVVTVSTNHIVIEHVKIVGGEFGIKVTNGAQGTVIQDCYLTHGKWRIVLDNARDTLIQRNVLTVDGIGFPADLPAGDWNNTSYPRIVNRHRYDENKFLVGDTETDDSQIELRGDEGTRILNNVLRDSIAGITFHGTTTNAEVAGNQIYRHSDNCIYLNFDYASGSIHHNLIYDCDHLLRYESTQQNTSLAIYANSLFQPSGGKHIFLSPPSHQPGEAVVGIYHNSCAGSGWCVDVGSDGQKVSLPFVHVGNILMSVDGMSSWGNVEWGTMRGIHNSTLWYGAQTVPDFKLPPTDSAVNSAEALSAPGMTAEYYGDGWPDFGSTQAGQGITPPTPVPPQPPATDTTPPQIQISAPSEGALISGNVAVEAMASDNVGVVSVRFLLDGAEVGSDHCCVSTGGTVDSRTIPNGPHTISARARDAAGNEGTASPINVIVFNGGTPPEPPTPTTGALTCTGELGSKGVIALDCVPKPTKR